jgi:hypothetical protein
MKGLAIRLGVLAAVAGAALVLATMTLPVPRAIALDGYVLFVGSLLLVLLVAATRAVSATGEQSVYERALVRRRRASARPRELAKLEREVVLGAATAFDVHMRLRPLLREIAAHRLASRRGLDLDTGGLAAREVLGEDVWRLVRPGVELPDDRFAPGLPIPALRAALDTLERI